MSARKHVFLICITAAGLALPASSQVSGNGFLNVQIGNSAQNERLPYMAEFKATQMRTLPDGSSIVQETTEVVAVDSQGRRTTATTRVPPQAGQTPETRFRIYDPVAHTHISWSSAGKEATVSAIPIAAASQCSGMMLSQIVTTLDLHGKGHKKRHAHGKETPTVKTTQEDLGLSTIQGIKARGQRTITTASAGAIGNIQPLVSTIELWKAVDPGLRGLVLREVSDDLRSGSKMSKELERFSQAEPDPSIFRVPPGYEIVNRELAIVYCPGADEMEPAP